MSAPPLPEIFGNYAIRGIQEVLPPEAVSWWPATPGWLVVAVALLAWLTRLGWRRWRRWQHDRYRREALAQLATLTQEPTERLESTAVILKITALAAYPRREIAGLSGDAWLDWLSARGARFSDSSRALLARHQYQANAALDTNAIDQLVAETSAWVRDHEAASP